MISLRYPNKLYSPYFYYIPRILIVKSRRCWSNSHQFLSSQIFFEYFSEFFSQDAVETQPEVLKLQELSELQAGAKYKMGVSKNGLDTLLHLWH